MIDRKKSKSKSTHLPKISPQLLEGEGIDEEIAEHLVKEAATRLRAIREALGLKQKELADRLGISGPSLSEFETAKYAINHELICNLYKNFNVNIYYLLYGRGDMFERRNGPLGMRLEQFAQENKDIKEFLKYFSKSSIGRYLILSRFKEAMLKERKLIQRDLEKQENTDT